MDLKFFWKNKTQFTNLSSIIKTKQITFMNSINMNKYFQIYKLIKVKTKKMKENTLKN